MPWISFLCTPSHLVGYQIYSQHWFALTPWDSEILRWLALSISFLDHVDKALSLIMIAMNSKGWGMILLVCTKLAFSKSIRTNGFGRRSRIHSRLREMMSATEQKPACLSILPSFAFCAVQIIPFNGLASGGPVREPWLPCPLPCRPRLCFVNSTSSFNETIALKVWVLKSVVNILGSTWVCGRLRPYPAWSCGRKPCWHVT